MRCCAAGMPPWSTWCGNAPRRSCCPASRAIRTPLTGSCSTRSTAPGPPDPSAHHPELSPYRRPARQLRAQDLVDLLLDLRGDHEHLQVETRPATRQARVSTEQAKVGELRRQPGHRVLGLGLRHAGDGADAQRAVEALPELLPRLVDVATDRHVVDQHRAITTG